MDSIFQGQHEHNGVDQPRINAKNIVGGSTGGGKYITLNAPGGWQVSNSSGILYCHPDDATAVTVKSVSCSYTQRDTYGLTFNLEILSDNQGISSGSNFMYFDLSSTNGQNKVWTQTTGDFFAGATLQPGQRLAYFSANPGNNLANFNVTVYFE